MRTALLGAAARACVERLEAAGAQPLADVLMFPVVGDGRRQWNHFAAHARVGWRESEQVFWARTAEVPFDIVPLRPKDPSRAGIWYAIGPAFAGAERDITVGDVLHVQAEATDPAPLVATVRQALEPWLAGATESQAPVPGGPFVRYCLAVAL